MSRGVFGHSILAGLPRAQESASAWQVFLSLGSHAVTWGFKYSKAEGSCLECRVEPGDALIRWGAARSWSARGASLHAFW